MQRRTGVDEMHKDSADTIIERSVRYSYDAMNRLIAEVSSSNQPTLIWLRYYRQSDSKSHLKQE